MITEDYVSFETAKLLKEKGFPQDPYVCNTAYTSKGNLSNNAKSFAHNSETYAKCGVKPLHYSMAPTLQMAMKWLRECEDIIVNIWWSNGDDTAWAAQYLAPIPSNPKVNHFVFIGDGYKTYEQACEAAIKYCLENLI